MDGKSNVTITVHTIGNIDTPNARENTRGFFIYLFIFFYFVCLIF